MTDRRLVLVDGHGVMYRSFHAIPTLSTSDGRATNAVYGFVRVIRMLRHKLLPTHMVVVFDGGSPPRRLALLNSYKAQRPAMPEALRGQFSLAEEYLRLAGISCVRIALEEADDVIATMADKAEASGGEVLVVTSDKDMYQLVSERVSVVPPSDTDRLMTASDVMAKTGVPPAMMVEWLALIGDTADNIDGVRGVGSKTAAKLLLKHGSVDAIYRELADVKSPAIRDALAAARDIVYRNISLVRLSRDLASVPGWEGSSVRAENPSQLLEFFRDLELGSLVKELERNAEKSILMLDHEVGTDTMFSNH